MAQPVGDPVPSVSAAGSRAEVLVGPTTTLRRPTPGLDALALHPLTHGSPEAEATWTYMGYGPWPTLETMTSWMDRCRASTDPWWYTITGESTEPLGMAAFLNHSEPDRRIEVGHIWYAPTAQRTHANTEAILLMGSHAFATLGCRRLEWKCDALNEPSRVAAERLGFTFEGIFRNHMIVKGRNRDTAWYSIVEAEWPRVEQAMRLWLYEEPRDRRGRQTRSLAEVRASLS